MPPQPASSPFSPEQIWRTYGEQFVEWSFNTLVALLVLVVGLWASGWIAGAVRRLAKRSDRVDDTLAAFFASIVRYGALAFVLIAVLDRFGVQTTQIIAVLGAATLAIGLALQGTLSNVAAGVMLVLFRPYRLGDFVEVAGRSGVVQDINIFTTELRTFEHVKIVLPNSQCWGAPISNFTFHPTRRLDLEFTVSYDTDLARAVGVIEAILKADPRVKPEPAPLVKPSRLGDFSITILVQVWCANGDLFHLRLDLTRAVKEAFDRAEISIPYPTNVTYHYEVQTLGPPPKAPPAKVEPPPPNRGEIG
jgi:small conductance mechanosensitive channel